jgi:ribosomal protein S18 acetylase RimI-like enzyme
VAEPCFRFAAPDDIPELHTLIERAYRGDSARAGWTHEADMLSGPRTDAATLSAILSDPRSRLLLALTDRISGCVQISDTGEGNAYLGLLCVDPALQASGLGRRLIAHAETQAQALFGARRMTMSVIEARTELIAYYIRRGYAPTGRRLDFPVPLDPPLFMTELAKPLA